MIVTPRTLALVVATAAVLALGVYLFVEVRAAPASPIASQPSPPPAKDAGERTGTAAAGAPTPRPAVEGARPAPIGQPPFQVRDVRPAPINEPHQPTLVSDMQGTTLEDSHANPRLDSIMDEANHAYDTGDFEQAKAIAGKILARQPTNVRMLRVMVSAECIAGDPATAQRYFNSLPAGPDRDQMRKRCSYNQVTLTDPPQ